jgi:hypothetical protein
VLKLVERRATPLGLDAPEELNLLLHSEAQRVADALGLDVAEVLRQAERILAREAQM